MSTIIRKSIDDVKIRPAVITIEDLPETEAIIRDVRYVKRLRQYFIFNGRNWQEFELVIG